MYYMSIIIKNNIKTIKKLNINVLTFLNNKQFKLQ